MKIIVAIFLAFIFRSAFAEENFIDFDGPNCLNGALVATKILPFNRYTSNSEMQAILHSDICQEVHRSERSKGDIGLIFDLGKKANPNIISHAFYYIDDSISFEKRGFAKVEPYHLVSTDTILADYEVEDIEGPAIKFFRCKTAKKTDLEIKKLEDLLQNKLINQSKVQIKKIAKIMLDNNLHNDIIASKLVSISYQLSIWGDKTFLNATEKWLYETNNINQVYAAILSVQ